MSSVVITDLYQKACKVLVFMLLVLCFDAQAVFAQQIVSQRLNGSILSFNDPLATGTSNFSLVIDTAMTIQTPVDVVDITVGNPDTVAVSVQSSKQIILSGLQLGSTNISFFDQFGAPIAQYNVDVTPDLRNLQSYLDKMIPHGRIEVGYLNGAILLTGEVSSVADVKRAEDFASLLSPTKIYNDISVTSNNQVALKVRIVELSRSVIKKLGINLDSLPKTGITRNNPATLEFSASGALNSINISAQIEALESAGYVKTLTDTVITALSGEQGSVHSGGQLRVQSGEDEFEYKDYGVIVDITPTVISPSLINLNVSAETSSVDTSSQLSGSLLTRKTNTTIELGSGSTMMISGLIQQEQSDSNTGVPLLKDIPLVGQLFRRRSYSDAQKELVVLVTPYLVKANKPEAFSTPVENLIPANDLSAAAFGTLNKTYERLPRAPRVSKVEGYGFIND